MKKRLISIFASLAIMMTMAIPVMAGEETITVNFPEGNVSNVDTNELITVDFPEAINFNTIATTTVYAEVQAKVGTYVNAGDKHKASYC